MIIPSVPVVMETVFLLILEAGMTFDRGQKHLLNLVVLNNN